VGGGPRPSGRGLGGPLSLYNDSVPDGESQEPTVLPRSEHPVSRSNIDVNALKVLYRLHRAGYRGLLVGGGVRDLMLGRTPKDFDVATDARPHEVRKLFRNSRIIGRRFRLAHVFFKEGIVEVATFRRDPDPEEQDGEADDLLITDDNVFGNAREDAFRRDFTVNALFYDIADFAVIDYVDGLEDLRRRLIRTIGDPDVRFPEDPVRMMRACELAGRLGFGIDEATQESIHQNRRLLERASPARLTEEVIQLLRCGAAGSALQWMLELGREVTDGGAIAALLLPGVLLRRHDIEALDRKPMTRAALHGLVEEVMQPFVRRFTLSRQRSEGAQQALATFIEMGRGGWKPADRMRLGRRRSFPDALLLLELITEATGGDDEDELEVWRDVDRRVERSTPRPPASRPKRRRRRRGGRRSGRKGKRR
jgi:poly(A) polymerase